jgi:hypothetical protein
VYRKALHSEEHCGSVLLTKHHSGNQIKKREVDGACGTGWGGIGDCRVLVGRSDGKNHLENLGVGGRMILKWISRQRNGEAWAGLA